MSHLDEVRAAIAGIREVTGLPIAATLSFDTNGRTMMGVTAAEAITALRQYDLAAVGANCGSNLPDTMAAVGAMHQADPAMPLIAKANAGIPRWGSAGQLVYDGTPEVMAGYAYHVRQMGAKLIGACCGSSPETIAAMRAALNGAIPAEQLERPLSPTSDNTQANTQERPQRRRQRRRKNG